MEKRLTAILVLLLFVDAGVVFWLQVNHSMAAWIFIVTYWAILTIKNFIDWQNNKEK